MSLSLDEEWSLFQQDKILDTFEEKNEKIVE